MDERIDYIIVLDAQIKTSKKLNHVEKYIKSLEDRGLKIQIRHGKTFKNNVYIIVHLPSEIIETLANLYDINILNSGHTFIPHSSINMLHLKILETPLSRDQDLYKRQKAGTASTCERILIVEEVLKEAQFGDNENETGIEKLVSFRLAKDAYPLHDGDCYLDDGFPINKNDRQLLMTYWGSLSVWYKEQPLNLIQKYYGSEVAFYFAFIGFYNTMLIPAAIIGAIFSIISIVELLLVFHERVDDICTSDIVLCPMCHSGTNCFFIPLNLYCAYAKVSIVFDNRQAVAFAFIMSFWATFFTNLWKRLENTLKIRWNVEFDKIDTKTRTEHKEKCTHRRWSNLTEKLEPYTPASQRVIYHSLSYGTCILLTAVVIVFVFGVIMYRVSIQTLVRISGNMDLDKHCHFILTITSALLQVAFIKLFGLFYTQLSEWLTRLENPRTQSEFDHSVIHKRYFLGFTNNYASLFYIAFLEGRFYKPYSPKTVTGYENDLCHPTGCFMSLCAQLCFLMLFKSFFGNVLSLFLPTIRKKIKRKLETDEDQWEKEYKLLPTWRYLLVNDFNEMIIQYGFVTFFVAAFPLAPLCALLTNTLELRLVAYKLVTRYRRPVPQQHSGIGAWNRILTMITHLSIATNAFVVAFTSDFVAREIYRHHNNNSLDGYIKSTLSLYDMKDFTGPVSGRLAVNPKDNSTLCYYQALRHPPDHPNKYQRTPAYWHELGWRLICVILFEHLIMLTNGCLAYFIPDVPQMVKETLHYEKNKELELKLKAQARTDIKNMQKRRTSVRIKREESL